MRSPARDFTAQEREATEAVARRFSATGSNPGDASFVVAGKRGAAEFVDLKGNGKANRVPPSHV